MPNFLTTAISRQIHNSPAIEFSRICGAFAAFLRDNKEIQYRLQALPTHGTNSEQGTWNSVGTSKAFVSPNYTVHTPSASTAPPSRRFPLGVYSVIQECAVSVLWGSARYVMGKASPNHTEVLKSSGWNGCWLTTV